MDNNYLKQENEKYKIEINKYKYSLIVMIILYCSMTFIDMLQNSISNQAVLMFCAFFVADRFLTYKERKQVRYIVGMLLFALIFIMFFIDYIIDKIS